MLKDTFLNILGTLCNSAGSVFHDQNNTLLPRSLSIPFDLLKQTEASLATNRKREGSVRPE